MRDFDGDFSDSQRGENVFNRIVAGFVESVDELNGKVVLRFEDFVGLRGSVELSFDYISSVTAGWIRFMPSIGDRVLCGFRPNNAVEILRYKALSYSQMAEFAANADPPFIFRQLKSGEFEIMSAGFAEIWGSKKGKLHLAGGLASIDLERDINQITHNAVLHRMISDGSEIRFGSIRRPNPTKNKEDEAMSGGFPQKEYKISLSQKVAGLATKLYDFTVGKVLNSTLGVFSSEKHPDTNQDLRADIKLYTVDGIQSVKIRVDQLGNVRVDLPATAAEGFKFVTALGKVVLEALEVDVKASTDVKIEGTVSVQLKSSVKVSIDAPMIEVGGNTGNVLTSTTAFSDFTGAPIQVGNPAFKSV
jgi:hypothetical protein